jgi:hypothetical protein
VVGSPAMAGPRGVRLQPAHTTPAGARSQVLADAKDRFYTLLALAEDVQAMGRMSGAWGMSTSS